MLKRALMAAVLTMGLSACGQAPVGVPHATGLAAQQMNARAAAEEASEDLGHFFKVDDNVYRGQQPTDAGFAKLKAMGVKTIVNLRTEDDVLAHEKEVTSKLGLNYVSMPINPLLPLKQESLKAWLRVANDPAMQPVFVHCQHGRDRTGAFVGAYRIQHDGWSFDKAYAEMKERGYRIYFVTLTYGLKKFARSFESTPAMADAI